MGANVGKIDQSGGFTFTSSAGDHRERVVLGVFAIELNVGAQNPIGLGIGAHTALLVQHADILWNHSEHRHLQIALNIFKSLDRGVEVFKEKGDTDAKD